MKPLAECLELIQGKSLEEFTREYPHPVLIGLGVIAGELQRNPAKAAGTMFLSLGSVPDGGENDPFVNQVCNIEKVSYEVGADGVYIGAGTENDIPIPDSSISKSHAHFLLTGDGCQLVDHGSTNGTFVNGLRVEAKVPTPIRGGDILTLGRFSFTYYDTLSFAKLLAVQAMARGRGRSAPRTPGAARGASAPTPARPGPPPTPPRPAVPSNGAAAPAPWNQPANTAAPGRPPPMVGPDTGGQAWSPGATGQGQADWQQRAIGRGPGGAGGAPQAGHPVQQPVQQSQQVQRVQPATPQAAAQPGPATWWSRLMLRLSNWLRKMAGE